MTRPVYCCYCGCYTSGPHLLLRGGPLDSLCDLPENASPPDVEPGCCSDCWREECRQLGTGMLSEADMGRAFLLLYRRRKATTTGRARRAMALRCEVEA